MFAFALLWIAPHPGPPVHVELSVGEERVVCKLVGDQDVLLPWLGLEGREYEEPLFEVDRADLAERAARFVGDTVAFTIDGVAVTPAPVDADVPPGYFLQYQEPGLLLELELACETEPRSVGLVWTRFEGLDSDDAGALPIVVRSPDGIDLFRLDPDDPECVWHARSRAERAADAVRPVVEERAPATWPALSIGLALATVVTAFARARRGRPLATLVPLVLLGGVVSALTWDVARAPLPWASEPRLPSEEQARTLFERLHRNLYAAFESADPDEVYELLAQTVDAAILDATYEELYESLIDREEGAGALSDVESLDVLDGALHLDPSGRGSTFEVDWHWVVRGVVTHWGHQHRRDQRYRARYTVAHDGRAWKIARADVLDYERELVEDEPVGR